MSKLPKPLVTVVIPCHDYAMYVTDAIKSVQAQTLNNLECWVVCDNCTDKSYEVAREATQNDARFHVVEVKYRSLSATRNHGIRCGTAPYLCCLDADDMMGDEHYLEVLVGALQKDRTLGIAFSSIQVMDADGKLGHVPQWPNGFDADAQYNHINQITSLCVFLREAWQRAGGFRPYYRYVEDAEFWTTVIDIGYNAIHATTQPWFHYRLHNKSASQVHRTGEIPEPDWLEYHPWSKDGQRPFAAGGKPPRGSWPVRFYNESDVTIIIPVGAGHEHMVQDALHSVEGQTHRYWECIVVQDSTVKPDLSGFAWVKLLSTKGNEGAGVARNLGAGVAQSPFLVFLDADDLLKPNFLEDTLAAYKQHGRYVYTDFLTHDRMTNWQVHPTPEYTFENIKAKPAMHPVTALIPKQWFVDVGGFDEELACFEDTDLFMKMMVKGYCGIHLAKPLLIYNLESGSRRKAGEQYEKVFKTVLKKRYGAYMEEHTMCNCVEPPKGKQPMAPTPDNAAEYKETYGEMVLAQLVGKFVAEAPVTFRGPATRVNYGRRVKGDIFYIWQADLDNSGDTFALVENYTTEPVPTIVPPPPESPTDAPILEHDNKPYEDELKTLTQTEMRKLRQNEWDVKELQTLVEKGVNDEAVIIENPEVVKKLITPRTVTNNPRRGSKTTATKGAKGGGKTK